MRTFINWVAEREPYFNPKIKWSRCFIDVVDRVPGVLNQDLFTRLLDRINRLIGETKDSRKKRYYLCHQRYVLVASGTGCRLSEIFYLTWKKIDFKQSTIAIQKAAGFTPKPKRESARFLPAYILEYLKNEKAQNPGEVYLFDDGKGKPAYRTAQSFSNAFRRHFTELKISGVKPTHGFRARFATVMRNELKQDTKTIQGLLGLSNIKVLDRYFSDIDQPQIDAIKLLDKSVHLNK